MNRGRFQYLLKHTQTSLSLSLSSSHISLSLILLLLSLSTSLSHSLSLPLPPSLCLSHELFAPLLIPHNPANQHHMYNCS